MKTLTILTILSTLTIGSSAAYARSSAYTESGWVQGFYYGRSGARDAVPQPGVPEPVAAETDAEAQEPGSAAQLGPELTGPAPAPQAVEAPEDLEAGLPDYDEETALRLARNAKRSALGYFTGWCYSYVADAMEMTGIIRRAQWYSLGIGVNAAADFASWANRNPGTLRSALKLARIETPARASDLPMGAIVVYNRGVCGFSPRSGHIEVKVAPDLLCSDGCQPAYQACFASSGARAGISVYVPVKKEAPKSERRFCRLAGSYDGKCLYRCNDGSDHELPLKRPSPFDLSPAGGTAEMCKQAVFFY